MTATRQRPVRSSFTVSKAGAGLRLDSSWLSVSSEYAHLQVHPRGVRVVEAEVAVVGHGRERAIPAADLVDVLVSDERAMTLAPSIVLAASRGGEAPSRGA